MLFKLVPLGLRLPTNSPKNWEALTHLGRDLEGARGAGTVHLNYVFRDILGHLDS